MSKIIINPEKILVFDADVIIHFINGDSFSSLKDICPDNEKVILDKVLEELNKNSTTKRMLDSAISVFKFIKSIPFPNSIEMIKEYAHLTSNLIDFGPGESACLSYCKYNENIVISNNLKDVKEYCKRHNIQLITTTDLVLWAYENGLWKEERCDLFLKTVIDKQGKIPCSSIKEYIDLIS